MKHSGKISISLAVLAVLASCSKNGGDDLVSIDGGVLSDKEVELSPVGGSFRLAFTSGTDWNVTGPFWLTVSPESGRAGTATVTLSAGLNSSRSTRSTELYFSEESVVNVVQPYPYLRIDSGTGDFAIDHEFNYNESLRSGIGTLVLPLESNVKWQVQADAGLSGFSVSALEGENDLDLVIAPLTNNYGKEPRSTGFDIVPVMEDGSGGMTEIPQEAADRYSVSLVQDNFLFLVDDSADELRVTISDCNETYSVVRLDEYGEVDASEPERTGNVPAVLQIEAESPWELAGYPEWLSVNPASGQNISVTLDADGVSPEREDRQGTVVLSAEDGNVQREIQVVQEGYLFDVESDDIQDGSLVIPWDDLSARTVTLNTNGPWEIRDIPEWLEVTPSSCDEPASLSGVSSHEITLKVREENLDFEDRTADIVFSRLVKPEGYGGSDPVDVVVRIVHSRFVFDVTPSPVLGRIPTMNTLPYPVEIECSGPWEIESVPDWLNIPVSSGTGNETIWVNAKSANPDMDNDRTAVLRFISLKHQESGIEAYRSVEIVQRKYTFELTPSPELQHIPAYRTVFPGYVLHLQCSAEWEIVSYPEWLVPDVTSGDGMEDVDIAFTPETNTRKVSRSDEINLRDSYTGDVRNVAVEQDGFVFDESSVSIDGIPVMNSTSYQVSFGLTAEAPWELVSYDEWTGPSALSGEGISSGITVLYFQPEPNPLLTGRTGSAVIRSLVNDEEKRVEFSQERYVFDDSPEEYRFTELSSSQVSLEVECSGPWTVDAPSWVVFSPSQGQSSQTAGISVRNNLTSAERTASCVLTSTLNGLERNITIRQDAFEFDRSPLSYSFTALEERKESFGILCSGGWTARNVPEWVTLSRTRGDGSEEGAVDDVVLSVSRNLDPADRQAVISFTSDDSPSLVKDVTVSQEGFVFDISVTSCEFGASAPEISDVEVRVDCSGEWTVSAAASWVNISRVDEDSFVVSVDENGGTSQRTSTVTVRSTLNGRTAVISVVQAGQPQTS